MKRPSPHPASRTRRPSSASGGKSETRETACRGSPGRYTARGVPYGTRSTRRRRHPHSHRSARTAGWKRGWDSGALRRTEARHRRFPRRAAAARRGRALDRTRDRRSARGALASTASSTGPCSPVTDPRGGSISALPGRHPSESTCCGSAVWGVSSVWSTISPDANPGAP